MIRKGIIVVLTLATVGSAYVWIISYDRPLLGDGIMFWNGVGFFAPIRLEIPETCGLGRPVMNPRAEFLGFSIYWANGGGDIFVIFPAWFPCTLFGAYPLFAITRLLRARRRHHRHEQGLCIDCGYDLTGNVTGVCSECGSTIEQPDGPEGFR